MQLSIFYNNAYLLSSVTLQNLMYDIHDNIVFCLFTAMVRRFTTMEPVCCSGGVYDWMSPSMLGTLLVSAGRGQGSPQSRDRPLGAGFTSHTTGVA